MTDFLWHAKLIALYMSPVATIILVAALAILLVVRFFSGVPSWPWVLAPLWGIVALAPFLIFFICGMIGLSHL